MKGTGDSVIAVGKNIILRDRFPSDVECHLRWQSQGEWRDYDAPWEMPSSLLTEEATEKSRARFLETCNEPKCTPRKHALIVTKAKIPVGCVSRYGDQRFPKACCIGIDICEDEYLNRGMGTEALTLWVEYLFTHSDLHRIEIATWSFNTRMGRVADKLGFILEGADRQLIEWKGTWLNRLHYGLLREEWELHNRPK